MTPNLITATTTKVTFCAMITTLENKKAAHLISRAPTQLVTKGASPCALITSQSLSCYSKPWAVYTESQNQTSITAGCKGLLNEGCFVGITTRFPHDPTICSDTRKWQAGIPRENSPHKKCTSEKNYWCILRMSESEALRDNWIRVT